MAGVLNLKISSNSIKREIKETRALLERLEEKETKIKLGIKGGKTYLGLELKEIEKMMSDHNKKLIKLTERFQTVQRQLEHQNRNKASRAQAKGNANELKEEKKSNKKKEKENKRHKREMSDDKPRETLAQRQARKTTEAITATQRSIKDAPTSTSSSKGATRGGGSRLFGGASKGITQMPQNPLLGRMAQFGMMASGMAATLFLMQMITAQIRNLMEVIKGWNEAILGVIDTTSMVGADMKGLSQSIRSYSRATGISGADIAKGVTAASSYGIAPSQANIIQMHGLSQSGAVGSPEAAAKLMAGAGTEFGDNMIKQAIKKWNIYSGKGEKTGTFGFEWDKIKGAGIELMLTAWDKYAKGFLLTMRAVSDYVIANRVKIVDMFDNFIEKLKSLWNMLKTISPALVIFMSLWTMNLVKTTIIQSISAVINLLPAFISGINTAGNATVVAAGKMTIAEKAIEATRMSVLRLKVAVSMLGIGLLAVAGTWAIMKLNDKAKEINKMNDAYVKFHHTSEAMIKTWSRAKMDQSVTDLGGAIGAMEATIPGLSAPQAKMMQSKLDHLREVYSLVQKINTEQKAEIESGAALAASHVSMQADRLKLLQEINKELGYMPAQYSKIQKTIRQQNARKNENILEGVIGEVGALTAKQAFKDAMLQDKALEQSFKNLEHNLSLVQGGLNSFEKDVLLVKAALEHLRQAGAMPLETLIALEKSIVDLNKAADAEQIRKYSTALDKMKTAVSQLDMTDFEKQIDNMRKTNRGAKPELELQAKIILGDKFKKQLATLQHKNLDLKGQKRDIQASSMPKADKIILEEHFTLKDNLAKLEVNLNREKEKGLTIASIDQVVLENKIKNTNLLIRANLGNITQQAKAAQTEKNNALLLLNLDIRRAKLQQRDGKLKSEALGYTSAAERAANLRLSELNTIKALLSSVEGMTDAERNRLAVNAGIAREMKAQLSTANELVGFFSGLDKLEGKGMSPQTELARKAQIQANAQILSNQGRDPSEYIRSAHFQLDQDKMGVQIGVWEQYYDLTGSMTKQAYENQLKIIQNHYIRNIKAGQENQNEEQRNKALHYAKLLHQEELHQLNKKNRRNLPLGEDLKVGAIDAAKAIQDQYKTLGQIMESTIGRAADGISSALHSMVMGTKNAKEAFKDMARSILSDLVAMIIKQEVFNMLVGSQYASGGSSIMGGVLGMFTSSQGNAVSGISTYSNQIVSKPTFAPMASRITPYATGGALFGEAGPEAIMPLSRMSSGNLGVETKSHTPNVKIEVINNGDPVEAETTKPRWDGEQYVIGVVLDAMQRNKGGFKNNMRGMLSA